VIPDGNQRLLPAVMLVDASLDSQFTPA